MRTDLQRVGLVVAALVGGLALLVAGFVIALEVRSVVAGPEGGPAGPVPNPGHAWTEVQGHGVDANATYINTQDNEALELRVNGSRALRLEPNATSPNVIGGYSGNAVTAGVYAAAIGGGGSTGSTNRVTDDYCTVGGGRNNQAGDNVGTTADRPAATVGGGQGNTASGNYATVGGGASNTATMDGGTVGGGATNLASGLFATVAGGDINTASGQTATVAGGHNNGASDVASVVGGGEYNAATKDYSTVGGGGGNVASGMGATIGGGAYNTASGSYATVPGGYSNTAQGGASFAAGLRAKANHTGAFVWADSTDADFASTTADQFLVRASGGVGLNVTSGALRLEPNATSANIIGGYSGNSVTASVVGAAVCGGGASGNTNRVTDDYGTVGGGANNQAGDAAGTTTDASYSTVGGGLLNVASGHVATVAGGWFNTASGEYATVGGGEGNAARGHSATVAGGEDNGATGAMSAVGGGLQNAASATHATVGGGIGNTASAESATVAGGDVNRVTDSWGTVAGGNLNQAGDNAGTTLDATFATVGGGDSNLATAPWATVGGGVTNTASGYESTVGGGVTNTASGAEATVPGGDSNTASGDYSFAAGRQAKANHQGAFVWADSTFADFASQRNDQLRARANGGARFDVNNNGWVEIYDQAAHATTVLIDTSTGAYLTTAGTWTNASSREQKENFTPVDGQAVLASLAEMPITTWNSKAEDTSIRHMGPVAQDFYAAFGLGASDTSIGTLDADGVALAAIQRLYGMVQDLQAENADLEARVMALEAGAGTNAASAEPGFPGLSPWWLALLGGLVVVGLVLTQRRLAGGRP